MPNFASPDTKRYQRGEAWEPYDGVVTLPVATGETIEHGDLVKVNASGEAQRISAADGAAPDFTGVKAYGVAVGRSAVVSADPDLYPQVAVKPFRRSRLVVLRLLSNAGAPATTSAANKGQPVTLRMGAASSAVTGVLGCNIKSGTDAIHGYVVDVVSPTHVLVMLDDDIVT